MRIPLDKFFQFLATPVRLRARFAGAPDIPTVAEAGLPGYVVTAWYALVAPTGTPRDIVDKLNEAARKAMEAASVKKLLDQAGGIASLTTPDELGEFIKSEIGFWKPIIEKSGAKVE